MVGSRMKGFSQFQMVYYKSHKQNSKRDNLVISVFTMKQMIEKCQEFNLLVHLAFIDHIKPFDSVNRDKLWRIMIKS